MRLSLTVLLMLVLAPAPEPASASASTGTLVDTNWGTQDMVYDARRNLIYIATPVELLRYDVGSGTLLSPVAIPRVGNLRGIDITDDDATLFVADTGYSATEAWVWVVDLDTLAVRKSAYEKFPAEAGTFSVAVGADRATYVTATDDDSSIGSLRRRSAAGEWTRLGVVGLKDTVLSASGDGQTIAFVQPGISDGSWGLYDVPTGQMVAREGYTNGAGAFAWEITTDRLGSQFVLPTYTQLRWFGDDYQAVSAPVGSEPIGARFHPVEPILYLAYAGTHELRTYDANSRSLTGTLDVGTNFTWPGNQPMWNGRIRLSRDGSLLMVSVNFGVRYFRLYAPLSLAPISGRTQPGIALSMPLAGAIGNGGHLEYSILTPPAHGTAAIGNGELTYTPDAGFIGRESFQYQVRYGRDVRRAAVEVNVSGAGQLFANNDAIPVAPAPRVLDVLANDVDSEGRPLQIIAVVQPQKGSVAIEGDHLVYTPPVSRAPAEQWFSYTISNGQGGVASAMVRLWIPARRTAPPIARPKASTAPCRACKGLLPKRAAGMDPR